MSNLNNNLKALETAFKSLDVPASQYEELTDLLENIKIEVEQQQSQLETIVKQHHFYRAALDVLPNPIFVKNEEAQFVYFNPEYEKYFHIQASDFLHKSVLDLTYLPLEERTRYQEEDLQLIKTSDVKHYETEFTLPNDSIGYSLYWSKGFECSKTGQRGLVGEIVDITVQKNLRDEVMRNVKELEDANEKIESLIVHDYLTGLYNRRIIEDFFKSTRKEVSNCSKPSLLLADLDYFKLVNDTFGHLVGDDMLVKFSSILQGACGDADLVVRYGGEEFLIVLFNKTVEEASTIAESIRSKCLNELLLPNTKPLTVSIGVTKTDNKETFHQAMIRVDHALYQAKAEGRNKVIVK